MITFTLLPPFLGLFVLLSLVLRRNLKFLPVFCNGPACYIYILCFQFIHYHLITERTHRILFDYHFFNQIFNKGRRDIACIGLYSTAEKEPETGYPVIAG